MKDVKIIQMTDEITPWIDGVDECRRLKKDEPLMCFRLKHHSLIEGETIFVDTDVMFNADVSDVFKMPFDICLTHRRNEIIVAPDGNEGYKNIVPDMPFNTGVIFSRSSSFWTEAYDFCKTLNHDQKNWYGDQISVKHVYDRSKASTTEDFYLIAELPCSTYNYTPLSKDENITERKIIHFKGERKHWMMLDKFELIGGVEIPKFNTYSAVDNTERNDNMAHSMSLGFEELQESGFHDGILSIACYGPSLQDTWMDLKHPILSVAGAHDFLISKGVIPDYHAQCDPRLDNVEFLKNAHPDVTYLMASCMHRNAWEFLKDKKVKLWHLYNGQETTRWLRKNSPNSFSVCGGSTIGLRAIELAGVLGFRNIEIHGMDSSFKEGKRHSGPHPGEAQKSIRTKIGEKWFESSPQMIEAAREAVHVVSRYASAGIKFTFFGDGLLQAMLQTSVKGDTNYKMVA